MGPRSEDRGYRRQESLRIPLLSLLQWVHGPRTVVIVGGFTNGLREAKASMGPRSEDRGYRFKELQHREPSPRFNGSTVRGPWLSN